MRIFALGVDTSESSCIVVPMSNTEAITTTHINGDTRTAEALAGAGLSIEANEQGYAISFAVADLEATLATIEAVKNTAVNDYIRAGGNPRNRRSFGSTYAAAKRAVLKASA